MAGALHARSASTNSTDCGSRSSAPGALPLHGVRHGDGDTVVLLRLLSHPAQARRADEQTLRLTGNPAERALLEQRLA